MKRMLYLLVVFLIATALHSAAPGQGWICLRGLFSTGTSVKLGPVLPGETLFVLPVNTRVDILGKKVLPKKKWQDAAEVWYRIRHAGKTGWITADSVSFSRLGPIIDLMKKKAKSLLANVRSVAPLESGNRRVRLSVSNYHYGKKTVGTVSLTLRSLCNGPVRFAAFTYPDPSRPLYQRTRRTVTFDFSGWLQKWVQFAQIGAVNYKEKTVVIVSAKEILTLYLRRAGNRLVIVGIKCEWIAYGI